MIDWNVMLLVRFALYGGALCLFISAACLSFGNYRTGRFGLWAALIIFLIFFGGRAVIKEFFPFTDKVESFVTLGVMILCGIIWYQKRLSKIELTVSSLLALTSVLAAFLFEDKMRFPPPFLRTVWFPLHVPLSFAAYGLWTIAAVKAAISLFHGGWAQGQESETRFQNHLNRLGFVFFTISMIFGGIWGYLAWGAYFLWDPKVIWSLIIWFYYGNLLHLDLVQKFAKWKEPLFILGFVIILITFIGTGFFSRSIHRF